MNCKPLTLGHVRKAQKIVAKQQVAAAEARKYNQMVYSKVKEVMPGKTIVELRVSSPKDKSIVEQIQEYKSRMGDGDWAPWSKIH